MPENKTSPDYEAAQAIWITAEIAEIRQREKVVALEQTSGLATARAEWQRLETIRIAAREKMTALLPTNRKGGGK